MSDVKNVIWFLCCQRCANNERVFISILTRSSIPDKPTKAVKTHSHAAALTAKPITATAFFVGKPGAEIQSSCSFGGHHGLPLTSTEHKRHAEITEGDTTLVFFFILMGFTQLFWKMS